MSYDRNSSDPLSDYEVEAPINNLDETAINKIARAWEKLDCASTKVATEKSGGGFYLSCGNHDRCSKDNFWFHIHILCDGQVILKKSQELEDPVERNNTIYLPHRSEIRNRTSISEIMNSCRELTPFDANKIAALLYLWAGYNNSEYCTMIDFIQGYENFCDSNLFN